MIMIVFMMMVDLFRNNSSAQSAGQGHILALQHALAKSFVVGMVLIGFRTTTSLPPLFSPHRLWWFFQIMMKHDQ